MGSMYAMNQFDTCSRVYIGLIPACDRQTDRQTDSRTDMARTLVKHDFQLTRWIAVRQLSLLLNDVLWLVQSIVVNFPIVYILTDITDITIM